MRLILESDLGETEEYDEFIGAIVIGVEPDEEKDDGSCRLNVITTNNTSDANFIKLAYEGMKVLIDNAVKKVSNDAVKKIYDEEKGSDDEDA